jgi:hypothetical protein
VRIVCEPFEIAVRYAKSGVFSSVEDWAGCGSSRSRIGVADVLEADGQTLGHAVEDEDVIDAAVRGPNDVAAFGVEISTQDFAVHKVFAGDLNVETVHDEVVVHVAALAGIAGR